ncbi:MAG: endonuclease domain-containing protein, partial [Mesorhizobium sp.]
GGEDRRSSSPPRSGGEVASRSDDGEGGKASRSRRKPGATAFARTMREDGTKEEALLWNDLKARKLGGHHFVRQLPIGPYFADFACRKQKLVVEIDGSQHADSEHDRRRDASLASLGWSTLRIWNHDVLKHRAAVCETILAALDGRLSENVTAPDLRFVSAEPAPCPSTRHTEPTP